MHPDCDYCQDKPATCVDTDTDSVHGCDACCCHDPDLGQCQPITPPTETTMTDPDTKPDPFFTEPTPTIVEGIADIQIRVFVGGAEVLGRDAVKVFCAVIAAQLETLWNSASQPRPVQPPTPPSPNTMNPSVGESDEQIY
jgi:hypothetical protein